MRILCCAALAAFLLGGCTKANPYFQDGDWGTGDWRADQRQGDGVLLDGISGDGANGDLVRNDALRPDGPGLDGTKPDARPPRDGRRPDKAPIEDSRPVDLARPPDVTPPPDVLPADTVPPQCTSPAQCDDGRSCTKDSCVGGKCVNQLDSQACLIGGTCYGPGDHNPAETCQSCNASESQSTWSNAANGTGCTADGLICTADICQSGACKHPLKTGFCLINGTCRANGWSAFGDPCDECVSKSAPTKTTFVDGKACNIGLKAGMCARQACRQWVTKPNIQPSGLGGGDTVKSTRLESVDIIAGNAGVWTVGSYDTSKGEVGGIIARIDGTSSITPPQRTKEPLHDVSLLLAVGDNGAAYLHGASGWKQSSAIRSGVKDTNRYGVWGRQVSYGAEFYLSGLHKPQGSYGVVRCVVTNSTTTCANQKNFSNNAELGPIFGVIASASQGRLWAAARQLPSFDDIYSKGLSGNNWSSKPPAGCFDGGGAGNQACSNTSGDFRGLHAADLQDAWIVGDNGMVLRYQGASGWKRITLPTFDPKNYQLTSVFSSAKDALVTLVGHIDIGGAVRQIVVFNYNRKLDRWFGPIPVATLAALGGTDPGQIRHIGGADHSNLWMVGDHFGSFGMPPQRRVGWVLKLQ